MLVMAHFSFLRGEGNKKSPSSPKISFLGQRTKPLRYHPDWRRLSAAPSRTRTKMRAPLITDGVPGGRYWAIAVRAALARPFGTALTAAVPPSAALWQACSPCVLPLAHRFCSFVLLIICVSPRFVKPRPQPRERCAPTSVFFTNRAPGALLRSFSPARLC